MNKHQFDLLLELIATSHLFLCGFYLLLNRRNRNNGITLLGLFLSLVGVHFLIISLSKLEIDFISKSCQSIFKGNLLVYFLFSYGPLLFIINKNYLSKEERFDFKTLAGLFTLLIPLVLSYFDPIYIRWPLKSIPLHIILIYLTNLIFILLAFWHTIREKVDVIHQKYILIHLNVSYLLMILIWIFVLVNREKMFAEERTLKIFFLLILIMLVDGIILLSLKYPDIITHSKYLRNRVKRWDSEKYLHSEISIAYSQKILSDIDDYFKRDSNFKKFGISLGRVSEELGYPQKDISQVVNTKIGMSFKEYINELKIDEAKQMIIDNPGTRINEVMFTVGFNSKSLFNKNFKIKIGMTPSEFRDSRRRKLA